MGGVLVLGYQNCIFAPDTLAQALTLVCAHSCVHTLRLDGSHSDVHLGLDPGFGVVKHGSFLHPGSLKQVNHAVVAATACSSNGRFPDQVRDVQGLSSDKTKVNHHLCTLLLLV